jgi:hypothetical protein|tara:strand:- start:1370 stop:1504 length:135 start_codon:yes stop_codon:yes gene_type:complete
MVAPRAANFRAHAWRALIAGLRHTGDDAADMTWRAEMDAWMHGF